LSSSSASALSTSADRCVDDKFASVLYMTRKASIHLLEAQRHNNTVLQTHTRRFLLLLSSSFPSAMSKCATITTKGRRSIQRHTQYRVTVLACNRNKKKQQEQQQRRHKEYNNNLTDLSLPWFVLVFVFLVTAITTAASPPPPHQHHRPHHRRREAMAQHL
jgi:hypothetical protein